MAAFGMGFGEILVLLMMGAFAPSDLEPLPVQDILSGMPAECEVVAFVDLRGGFEEINSLISDLSTRPWVLGNREMSEMLSEVSAQMSRAPAEATAMFGFDPFSQMTSISFCGRLGTAPSGDPMPSFLIVARGNFDTTLAAMLASQVGLSPITLSNGSSAYGSMESGTLFGMASPTPGVLFVGSDDLLAPRAATVESAGWETATPDSLVGRVAALAPGGPRAYLGFQPSAGTRFLLSSEMPVSLAQLIGGLSRLVWMTDISSSQFEVQATSATAMSSYELIFSGVAAYAEAAPLAVRAFAQVALGVLSADDPELDPGLRALVAHRDDFLSFLDEQGFFQEAAVAYNADESTMTVSLSVANTGGMEATSLLVGMGMWGAMMFRVSAPEPYYYEEAYPPPAYAPPAGP